mgnify:CR=1
KKTNKQLDMKFIQLEKNYDRGR